MMEVIKSRRSVREFKEKEIASSIIKDILEAGRWAPSGLNNQPWRFMVLLGKEKDNLSQYTKYSEIIKNANKLILVFLDKDTVYNYEKDIMAIGACIQNMLLYIQSINLGACWLGEILNQRQQVQKLLNTPRFLELEAVLAVGVPLTVPKKGQRKKLDNLMVYPVRPFKKKAD